MRLVPAVGHFSSQGAISTLNFSSSKSSNSEDRRRILCAVGGPASAGLGRSVSPMSSSPRGGGLGRTGSASPKDGPPGTPLNQSRSFAPSERSGGSFGERQGGGHSHRSGTGASGPFQKQGQQEQFPTLDAKLREVCAT